MIFFTMILLGMLLGFAGAGGAGLTITLLTVGFNVPYTYCFSYRFICNDLYHAFRYNKSFSLR